ncbi:MAG: hypothetical protein QM775_34270 [Pirellulales bacterium]
MSDYTRSITELIAAVRSDEITIAAPASRELLLRWPECRDQVSDIVELLRQGNAAVEDIAWHILSRLNRDAVKSVISALPGSTERFRTRLLGLLPIIADFSAWLPIVQAELKGTDKSLRFFAADCIGRSHVPQESWPAEAMVTLNETIEILWSAKRPENQEYWSQARLTLKHLGLLS